MIVELEKTYRGVLCPRCGARSAAPARALQVAQETYTPQTFLVRCAQCEGEGRFSMADVRDFSGEPQKRVRRSRAKISPPR